MQLTAKPNFKIDPLLQRMALTFNPTAASLGPAFFNVYINIKPLKS
jgi:hypothetical protein